MFARLAPKHVLSNGPGQEVRRAHIGPGHRRQARWAGREGLRSQGRVPEIVSAELLETISGCP